VPFVWIATPEKQEHGLSLTIGTTQRIAPEAVDPTVKNYHWLDLVSGLFEAYEQGSETVVLTDGAGHVVEGPGFNVFALSNGRLVTPDRGVLEGVTRRTAMDIAREMGLRLDERPLASDELRRAQEAFATSTAGGIIPITRVDGQPLADARPGPTTRLIRDRYWALHGDPRYATPVSYADDRRSVS
jgi:branched-chain amino acid aminotransferase